MNDSNSRKRSIKITQFLEWIETPASYVILTESTFNSFWSEGNFVPRVRWRSIRGRSASPLTATPSRLAMTDLRGMTPSLEILHRGPSGPMWRRITFEQRLDTSQSMNFSRFKLWTVFHNHSKFDIFKLPKQAQNQIGCHATSNGPDFRSEWPTLLLLMICWELGMACACPPTLACPLS